MTLSEYQESCKVTAIYKHKLVYPVLGLVDEVGEFLEKIHAEGRDNKETAKEMGDVFWYMSSLCTDCGLSLTELCVEQPIDIPTEQLLSSLFYLCGKTKKILRDTEGEIRDDYKEAVRVAISNLFTYFVDRLHSLDTTIEDVLQSNIDKLLSRMERGVLKGSGDNR